MSENRDNLEQRRYSSDEVADIVRISLQQQNAAEDGAVDFDELLTIGKDFGLDREHLEQAIELLESEQQNRADEASLWLRFKTHGLLFIGINLLLISINIFTGLDRAWSLYVLFGWGLFLIGHYAGLRYAPDLVALATERTRQLVDQKYQSMFEMSDSVSFTIEDSTGMAETRGMLSLEDEKLMMEHQTFDALFGVLKGSIKLAEFPLAELAGIRLEQKLWSADIVLQGKNLRVFANVPGSEGGQLRIPVNRQSSQAARNLVAEVQEKMRD